MNVKKETLIIIAGIVWLLAGFNVARIGVLAYADYLSVLNIVLSVLVFAAFGTMFFKMSQKHIKRIRSYQEARQNIFRFFDVKSYCIMIFMMGGGIWLRYSGLAPLWFIAFFYTGLGVALALAGVLFVVDYFKNKRPLK
ncbi:MAG: hypothetical protein RR614_00210 [Eubacterium sp.]